MLITNQCRVIFTAYVNNGTLSDFYSILSITKLITAQKLQGTPSLYQRRERFFNIYLIIKVSLTRIKINSPE